MLARVATFYAESEETFNEVCTALDADLPAVYGSIAGFRGCLLLKQHGSGQVMAVTLWEDVEAMKESEPHARRYTEYIDTATGMRVSRNFYEVIGSINIPDE